MLTQSEFPHMCWVAVCSLCCPTAESLLCNCTVTECSWYVWLVCVCGSCMLSSVYAKFCVSGMGLGNVRVYVQSALSESNLHKLNGRLGRGSVWVLFSVFCCFFCPSWVGFSLGRGCFFGPVRLDLGRVDCMCVR